MTEPAPQPPRALSPGEFLKAWMLLLVDRGANYGYELYRELAARRVCADRSAVYRVLRKLEREGCLASRWMRPIAGPPRRSYRLSPIGRRRLDETAGLIAAERDLHDQFLRVHEQGGAEAHEAADREPTSQ